MIRAALKRSVKALIQRVLDGRPAETLQTHQPAPGMSSAAPSVAQQEQVVNEANMEVTVQGLQERIRAGEVALLDVRESFEVMSGKLADARHIPLNQLPARVTELDAQQPLVVYCAHGMRSYSATAYLRSQGFQDVTSLAGGIVAWVGQGGEVVRP